MSWIVQNLWLIPAMPLLAAGLTAVLKRSNRVQAMSLAIGSMGVSLLLSLCAFIHVVGQIGPNAQTREVFNFRWFEFGMEWVKLGWVLDPLTAVMLVMVTLIGLLIFIYSAGYMANDENLTRFFCFLSLFAGAMLGLVVANSLLLLFMSWELVGLASYMLIGFWYQKPSAAAAAKKAFITTRIGDLAFLLGIVWLYSQAGTLLFYDGGGGCIEQSALLRLVAETTSIGMAASTGIALLIFCGAAGKSGQLPLHVWLPDAMEGPTPVSALIHAATMVAAGVFLIARVYPLTSMTVSGATSQLTTSIALQVVVWVGAVTAIFAAAVAAAQNDIKRILAYSTISQLGYMMMGLGVGGVAVGMFHLITHAFFKALLFLGAGSVIHGCHEEQDIRRMGGLRQLMPLTFATYAIGMLALSGFPLFFSGFWSKDEILHAASLWNISRVPFYIGITGSLLTAFYMARQVCYVFFGESRLSQTYGSAAIPSHHVAGLKHGRSLPHESPAIMTTPLIVLSAATLLLAIIGTPAWPWFQAFIAGKTATVNLSNFLEAGFLPVMLTSSTVVIAGLALGWWVYGRSAASMRPESDALEHFQPQVFRWLQHGFYVDAFYRATIIRLNGWFSVASNWFDVRIWNGTVSAVSYSVVSLSRLNSLIDTHVVNRGFDEGCRDIAGGGRIMSRLHGGMSQIYLRLAAGAVAVLIIFLVWSA
jgi:NADH-quinone oxidoreductase subunit L